jgi:hypothetical protein
VGITVDKGLTCLPHVDYARKKSVQRMGMLVPLINGKSDLSVTNRFLLTKQLIRPLMDYACPSCNCAARSHVRRLQVSQSKCFRLGNFAPWYVSNMQVEESLDVPYFRDHIGALTANFESKLADVVNPGLRQFGSYLR